MITVGLARTFGELLSLSLLLLCFASRVDYESAKTYGTSERREAVNFSRPKGKLKRILDESQSRLTLAR